MSSIAKKLRELKDYRSCIDDSTREKIVVEYAPLVKFIAQRIASRLPANVELDDLISCGVIGLIDAIKKFDPTRDNKFKTYAEFRIRGAILDELRSQDWVPRSVREKAKTLDRAYNLLEKRLGRIATDDEVCEELEITKDVFFDMINKTRSVSILNIDESSTFNRNDKRSLTSFLEKNKSSNPFEAVNFKKSQERIKDGIKSLPEKQRLVLTLYYYEDLNLKEIGQVLDVTESRVSQLHTQAILRLKSKIKGDFDSMDDVAA